MEARCRIMDLPEYSKVVIGQIHGYSGKKKPLIKLQYFKGRIEAIVKVSPNKGKDKKLKFPGIDLDEDISWTIKLDDGVLSVAVNGETKSRNMLESDEAWAEQTFYFKAGAYPQGNKGDESEGARISFSELRVSHEN